MRCAVFHDYFGAVGGGEKVAVAIAQILGADIITTDTGSLDRISSGLPVRSLGKTYRTPPLKQISATHLFSSCDFSDDYDLSIFSGNWAHHASAKHHPNFWYCHTPVRAFYDLYETFLRRQPFLQRQAFALWTALYRRRDQRAVTHVDRIMTNSQNTLGRIHRYYQRDADIVYPPIETSQFAFREYGDFWLSVNRLYPEKRIELQIETFRSLPEERLVIVGGYAEGDHADRYAHHLNNNLPANVELAGEVPYSTLRSLYAECKGFITTALDEDFGMTPLEAMASGKAVVAVREGGYMESVINGETGFLVPAEVPSLVEAVLSVSQNPERFRDACISQSGLFDISVFEERLKTQIHTLGVS